MRIDLREPQQVPGLVFNHLAVGKVLERLVKTLEAFTIYNFI